VNWLWAFLFTQAVEVPIYVVGARTRIDEGFCASAITHPIVWFVWPALFDRLFGATLAPGSAMYAPLFGTSWTPAYLVMVVFAEAFAFGVEGAYLRWLKKSSPFMWSLAANAASLGLGLVSRAIFGVP
jgi:hypothetical protein